MRRVSPGTRMPCGGQELVNGTSEQHPAALHDAPLLYVHPISLRRMSPRLELTGNHDHNLIEQLLKQKCIEFSHQIIHHGRALCVALKPKCAECPLENLCHAADKTWST